MDPLVSVALLLNTARDVDLTVVTDRTGVVPSEVGRVGQAIVSPSGVVRPQPARLSWWRLRVPSRRTDDLESVIVELLDQLGEASTVVRDLAVELGLDVTVDVGVVLGERAPMGSLGRAVVARLADLGAGLSLDLYLD